MGKHGPIADSVERIAYREKDNILRSPFLNAKRYSLYAKNGFTLLEIVVALGLLAIGILGVLSLFPVGLDAQKRALDYSNVRNLAEWKMADIYYEVHQVPLGPGFPPSNPTAEPDPEPFDQNPKYLWHYNVTQAFPASLPNLYRIDLYIYSVEDDNTVVEKVVSYIEKPV